MRRFRSMAGSGVLFLELGLGLGDIEAACSPSRPATPGAINTQVQYPGEPEVTDAAATRESRTLLRRGEVRCRRMPSRRR